MKVVRHVEKNSWSHRKYEAEAEELRAAPGCPLSLLRLQVSSTPNLIALISQLNTGRQKKDNSHPFWGRIRRMVLAIKEHSHPGRRREPNCLPKRSLGVRFTCTCKEMLLLFFLGSRLQIRNFDSVTEGLVRFVAALVPHTSKMTHSSEQLDGAEQVTGVIRLGECEVLTPAR